LAFFVWPLFWPLLKNWVTFSNQLVTLLSFKNDHLYFIFSNKRFQMMILLSLAEQIHDARMTTDIKTMPPILLVILKHSKNAAPPLQDLDEVRIGILKHLADFLRMLKPQRRREYLPRLSEFLKMDNDSQSLPSKSNIGRQGWCLPVWSY